MPTDQHLHMQGKSIGISYGKKLLRLDRTVMIVLFGT